MICKTYEMFSPPRNVEKVEELLKSINCPYVLQINDIICTFNIQKQFHTEQDVEKFTDILKERGMDFYERSSFMMPDPYIYQDNINHPKHYTSSKAVCDNCKESIECIEITRHMSFNIGNAVKYLWRHELKGGVEDLKKAKWYINDAIKQLEDKCGK